MTSLNIRSQGSAPPPPLELGAVAAGGGSPLTSTGVMNPQELQKAVDQMMRDAGFEKDAEGSWVPVDRGPIAAGASGTAGAAGATGAEGVGGAGAVTSAQRAKDVTGTTTTALGPVSAPKVSLDAEARKGAESFANAIDAAFNDAFVKGYDDKGDPIYKKAGEVSSDDLLAAFLKLQLTDPNNSVEVQHKLLELSKDLRKGALEQQRAELEKQAEALKEAQEKSGSAKVVGIIATVVIVAVALVATFLTFGAAAMFLAAAVIGAGMLIGYAKGGFEGMLLGAQIAASLVLAVVTFGQSFTWMKVLLGLAAAGAKAADVSAQKQAADAALAAEERALAARRAEMRAEEAQKDVQARNELIRMIMEAKGNIIEAVLKMMTAMHATNLKLATIAASR